jgi:tRNA(fMet)-specific endonuclease VapC
MCFKRPSRSAVSIWRPIRAELEKRGRLIGPYDLMIAAHAKSVDAVLVTDNTGEFARVDGLKTTDWL